MIKDQTIPIAPEAAEPSGLAMDQSSRLPVVLPENPRIRFSSELLTLEVEFAGRGTSISEILVATQAKGVYLLLVLLSLPMLAPIPLPGVSSLFGFVVLLIGLQLVLGDRSWLPKRILEHKLPARFIGKVLDHEHPSDPSMSCKLVLSKQG